MTSYPTFSRKYTSAEPIFVKIGTIVHFDSTSSQKKIQNDSDIFCVVMTSSFFADDVISDDFDDVITTSKMSESFWIFFCELVLSKWTIVPILTKIGSAEVYFLKNVGYDVIPQKWWRHNSVKNVGIDLNFLRWIFTAELKVWVNF